MDSGYYKLLDKDTPISLWVDINFPSIPTEAVKVLAQLDGECGTEYLERCSPADCETCDGTGEVDEAEDDIAGAFMVSCDDCSGTGTGDETMLDWPVGWGTMWQARGNDNLKKALCNAGFIAYEPRGDMALTDLVFGIDGCGYGFYAAHWIPLRASLAILVLNDDLDQVRLAEFLQHLEELCEKEEASGGTTFRSKFGDAYIKESNGQSSTTNTDGAPA